MSTHGNLTNLLGGRQGVRNREFIHILHTDGIANMYTHIGPALDGYALLPRETLRHVYGYTLHAYPTYI